MTGAERIAQLKAENAALRAEVKALRKQLMRVLALPPARKRLLKRGT